MLISIYLDNICNAFRCSIDDIIKIHGYLYAFMRTSTNNFWSPLLLIQLNEASLTYGDLSNDLWALSVS